MRWPRRRSAGIVPRSVGASLLGALALFVPPQDADVEPLSDGALALVTLQAEAEALRAADPSPPVRSFLEAVSRLPEPLARTLLRDEQQGLWVAPDSVTPGTARRMPAVDLPAASFYTTRYGSPLASAWALEHAAAHGMEDWDGRRILDFGYGSIAPLRLLALCGADAVGVDVDSWLAAVYSDPSDVGPLGTGSVSLVHGRWPAEPEAVEAVGGGYDLILSKNTLKRGYLKPAREPDPRQLIQLGVDDEVFLARLFDALRPGGLVVIANLCPPQNPVGRPYIPWADGQSPFSREQWEAAGFVLEAFDQVDDDAARELGVRLGWGDAATLESSLFAWVTVARRPIGLASAGRDAGEDGNAGAGDDG